MSASSTSTAKKISTSTCPSYCIFFIKFCLHAKMCSLHLSAQKCFFSIPQNVKPTHNNPSRQKKAESRYSAS
ncbi:hypothetical protein CFH85_15805 [Bacillus safensis]|nr:hypothetical protein CFH85_15805 [Bacillus safensis]